MKFLALTLQLEQLRVRKDDEKLDKEVETPSLKGCAFGKTGDFRREFKEGKGEKWSEKE